MIHILIINILQTFAVVFPFTDFPLFLIAKNVIALRLSPSDSLG